MGDRPVSLILGALIQAFSIIPENLARTTLMTPFMCEV